MNFCATKRKAKKLRERCSIERHGKEMQEMQEMQNSQAQVGRLINIYDCFISKCRAYVKEIR